jgi:hypothetical protein
MAYPKQCSNLRPGRPTHHVSPGDIIGPRKRVPTPRGAVHNGPEAGGMLPRLVLPLESGQTAGM